MTGSSGMLKPGDAHVVMTSSAFSTEGSDGGGRIAGRISSVDRSHVRTCRLGGPDHQQTEVRGLQNGQVVLLASNRYRRIDIAD